MFEIGAIEYSRVSRNLRSTWYSSANPKPPCTFMQTLAASQEASEASSLAMLASGPQGSWASNRRAASRRIRSAARTAACARASAYAREREVFGRPIGSNQGVQFPIARAHVQVSAAALMVDKAAAMFDAGQPCGTEANMAKMLASEASWYAADQCLQIHGGFGFAEEYDIERKFRETRLYQVAPISTNLILSHVATHVLGLPKSF